MANKFRGLWRKHVMHWRESGLTQADYAKRHGLSPKTLSAWVVRAKKLPASLTSPVEVFPMMVRRGHEKQEAFTHTPSPSTSGTSLSQRGQDFELRHVTGWSLTIPAGTGINELAQLLRELR